jgi:hypothetical protein
MCNTSNEYKLYDSLVIYFNYLLFAVQDTVFQSPEQQASTYIGQAVNKVLMINHET